MELYVVQTGDTIDSIATKYGVSVNKLIVDNRLTNPERLVPGEVVIIVRPSQTYTIQEGDTLESIAASHNITVNELLRNNPILSDMDYIYPGEVLTIRYNQSETVATHGYANTFIKRNILKKTLPYLTYLSIFNYRTVKNGELSGTTDDKDIIQLAKEHGVIPLMLMTTLSVQGEVDIELTYEVLINEEVQNKLFDNVIKTVKENGYSGVNISAQYITSTNQSLFYQYTKNLSDRLRKDGLITIISINPKVDTFNNEIIFEKIEYSNIVNLVDAALFLQYKWGINNSPPAPVISIDNLKVFLDYAKSKVATEKIFIGIQTLGYVWELPFVNGFSRSNSLTIDSAINLARDVGATILFDEKSQTPYFKYENVGNNSENIVWFVNAITIDSMIRMMLDEDVPGTGIWNIMTFFTHLWLVINCQYKILKLLPEF
jgi:spore germination protein